MNVIMSYLDTMFSTYPQTQRILEAKAELAAMMEDAYSSLIASGRSENEAVGQIIRDFGNLEEVAPVLGITYDIAPEGVAVQESAGQDAQYPPVTLEEAQGYADVMARIHRRIGTAVMLFVLSPVVLIALPAAATANLLALTETAALFVGLLVLFILVGTGVVSFISISRQTAPFKRIPERKFAANPVVTQWSSALAESHERERIRGLQIMIVLWILAPIPLIAFTLFLDNSPQSNFWTVIGVVFVLVTVAVSLKILLPRAWAHTVATELSRGKGTAGGFGNRNTQG